ncbi:hypothetical protein KI387_005850 [Taxus chinensis]|uniref:Uncharacterized protein n=1 Tax=Taxus chinensis TaxID=29808 RepID=A0AA38LLJ1_TAXCH|nr:hypothetical protein KI387_005850 [Taxus chinensis]
MLTATKKKEKETLDKILNKFLNADGRKISPAGSQDPGSIQISPTSCRQGIMWADVVKGKSPKKEVSLAGKKSAGIEQPKENVTCFLDNDGDLHFNIPDTVIKESIDMHVFSLIGTLIGFDGATKVKSRLNAARFCITVNESQKLPSYIDLHSSIGIRKQKVEFEEFRMKCKDCSKLGHKSFKTSKDMELKNSVKGKKMESVPEKHGESSKGGKETSVRKRLIWQPKTPLKGLQEKKNQNSEPAKQIVSTLGKDLESVKELTALENKNVSPAIQRNPTQVNDQQQSNEVGSLESLNVSLAMHVGFELEQDDEQFLLESQTPLNSQENNKLSNIIVPPITNSEDHKEPSSRLEEGEITQNGGGKHKTISTL